MIKTDAIKTKVFFENSYKNHVLKEDRKKLLSDIATKITDSYQSDTPVYLNFICTHNSRRSQLGQVWGFYAAHYFDLNIGTFSGGTEVTAFHRNTVKTLQEVGFSFKVEEFSHLNPVYRVSFEETEEFLLGFSKIFDDQMNKVPYIAITTCNSADENCPFIAEAKHRFHLPFVDPKHSDGSEKQNETYLKTNGEIAAEMFFIFSQVKSAVKVN